MFDELPESVEFLLRKYWLFFVIGLAGVGLVGFGMMQMLSPSQPAVLDDSTTSLDQTSLLSPHPTLGETISPKEIVVDIEGAVTKPGVYQVISSSRLQDVVVKAGGFSAKADHEQIAKSLNLAEKLSDGMKIYVPFVGDTIPAGLITNQDAGSSGMPTSGIININTASATELDNLPGVGQVTAQKIITNRPYAATQDLLDKKVVNQKVFSEIKDSITTE